MKFPQVLLGLAVSLSAATIVLPAHALIITSDDFTGNGGAVPADWSNVFASGTAVDTGPAPSVVSLDGTGAAPALVLQSTTFTNPQGATSMIIANISSLASATTGTANTFVGFGNVGTDVLLASFEWDLASTLTMDVAAPWEMMIISTSVRRRIRGGVNRHVYNHRYHLSSADFHRIRQRGFNLGCEFRHVYTCCYWNQCRQHFLAWMGMTREFMTR